MLKINNPIQMNDWEIKKFLKVILAVQLAMWGAIGLDSIGIQIPILRQFISFVYLIFVPGIIILRILKLHKLGNIETLLYTVGLSISALMFIGLFTNTVFPFFGISGPISIKTLIITISAVILILCILCYKIDRYFSDPSFIDVRDLLALQTLFLSLIPFLAILGTYLVNFHRTNILLLFLIIVIVSIVLMIGFDIFVSKKFFPLAVFVIAISLLFHNSLISMYIWGWDIHYEYSVSSLVLTRGFWDSTIPSYVNSMLSIVMLSPIFSNISDLSLSWVLKIVYPFLFSLVPVGLYRVFQKQTDEKIAFLACLLFVSFYTFYTEMLALARQEIAELFLVLLLLLMVDKNMSKMIRSLLLIIFSFSLGVSHYGLSYIYMIALIVTCVVLYFDEQFTRRNNKGIITNTYVLLFIAFIITWYMNISSSLAFNSIVRIGDHIASNIIKEFLKPEAAQGLEILTMNTVSPLHEVARYIYLLVQFFISIGILTYLMGHSKMRFEKEYTALSGINFIFLLASISVPYFASSLNTTRLYQITLIFLAPFGVLGGVKVLEMMNSAVGRLGRNQNTIDSLKVLSVFLAIFLLFNTGFLYEIAKDNPTSISLNTTIDFPRFNELEVLGAKWLYDKRSDFLSYADSYRWQLLGGFGGGQVRNLPVDINKIQKDSYIYFGKFNIINEKVLVTAKESLYKSSGILINDRDKIYDNGGATIYR